MDEFDEFKKKKKKLLDDATEGLEVDEDSDFPVHEKFTKEKKVKHIKKEEEE
ncbi:hypothetical protein ACFL0W_04860 [Nanoarchaeota archaeon]